MVRIPSVEQHVSIIQALLPIAVGEASLSPCAHSKRGALLIDMDAPPNQRIVSSGFNSPPDPFSCAKTERCAEVCRHVCEHAEQAALRHAQRTRGLHMLHVKAVDGRAVAGGGPSCMPCSVAMLARGVGAVWLLHTAGWHCYPMLEFHALTVRNVLGERVL